MSQRVILGTWGANIALRLPRDIARQAGFSNGTAVEVEARDGEVIVRAAAPRYRLDDLLRGMTPETMRDAFDWGPDQGREAVA